MEYPNHRLSGQFLFSANNLFFLPAELLHIIVKKIINYSFYYWYGHRITKLLVGIGINWVHGKRSRKSLQSRTLPRSYPSSHVVLYNSQTVGIGRGKRDRDAVRIKELEYLKRHVTTYQIILPVSFLNISFLKQ